MLARAFSYLKDVQAKKFSKTDFSHTIAKVRHIKKAKKGDTDFVADKNREGK